MATTEDFTAIVRALNGVSSAGQARAAAGAALIAAGDAYKILPRLPDDRERATRTELDQARMNVEGFYQTIKATTATADVRQTFASRGRKAIEKIYITIGGIEAEASYVPQTSNLSILAAALADAPAVFVGAVGQVAGTVVNQAGKVVGNAAGGILSGLGLSGTLTLVVVGVVILLVVTRGSLLGLLFRGGGS